MKRNLFRKVLCCLLAVCLLSGCTSKSPLLAYADDDTGLKKKAIHLELYNGSSVKNSEGQELRYFPEYDRTIGQYRFEVKGKIRNEIISKEPNYVWLALPFSKVFTVDTMNENYEVSLFNQSEKRKYHTGSEACFFFEGDNEVHQYARGYFKKVVHHCNNVIELFGDLSEVFIMIYINDNSPDGLEEYNSYDLRGVGTDHVVVALVDGEILTEGMMGNYTVSHYIQTGSKVTEIVMEYDETGNLLSTTEN